MDLHTLSVFVDVVRRGSFAAVARDRDTDPSTISRAIRTLETELGVRLLQRTTRRLSLTEAGRIYFERVEPLVDELDRARHAAIDVSAAPAGNLKMTASIAFGQTRLVPLLPELGRRFPDLGFELILSDANLDLVAERIDLAVRLGPRLDTGMIGTRLMDTWYRVVASPDYVKQHGAPASPAEIAERDCLLFALPAFRSHWLFKDERGAIEDVPVHGRFVISSAIALREMALAGLGPALLVDWLIDNDVAGGRLVDLFPGYRVTATDFETAAWVLYPSRAYLPLKVRTVIDFLRSKFPS